MSKALSKPVSRPLIRRRVSASATPIEVFGNDPDRSMPSVAKPDDAGEPVPHVVAGRVRVEHQRRGPARAARPASSARAPAAGRACASSRCPSASPTPGGVVGHRRGRAVLQALLPAGGEQAERLARGHDEVHLRRRQRLHHAPGLLGGRRREELVADQAGALGGRQLRADPRPRGAVAARARWRGWPARAPSARTTGGHAARSRARRPRAAQRSRLDQMMVWR